MDLTFEIWGDTMSYAYCSLCEKVIAAPGEEIINDCEKHAKIEHPNSVIEYV